MSERRRLKDENTKWLIVIGTLNAGTIAWAGTGYEMSWAELKVLLDVASDVTGILKTGAAAIAGAVGVLISNMATGSQKLSCLYGKPANWPFSKAFTYPALDDHRVDEAGLRKKVVPWPVTWQDQSKESMKLLRKYGDYPSVADNHRRFLLLRDWAWLALILGIVGVLVSGACNGASCQLAAHTMEACAQVAVIWLVARKQGVAFRQNLLSVASTT